MSLLSARGLGVAAPTLPGRPREDAWILQRTELELEPGDSLAVQGPSGSGKTTLLRALALLEPRATGEVLFLDRPIADRDVPAYRRAVCYLPQQPPRFPGAVRDSLAALFRFRSAHGLEWNEGTALRLCERLALPRDVLDRKLSELSVGEAQRVSLVRALLVEPQILLLDEPTSALDPASREAAEALLAAWKYGERAIVLVTHDLSQIARLATRQVVLEAGQLRTEQRR